MPFSTVAPYLTNRYALCGYALWLASRFLPSLLRGKVLTQLTAEASAKVVQIFVYGTMLLGVLAVILGMYETNASSLYFVNVTVLDPDGRIVDDARITSSPRELPKTIPGGAEFQFPKETLPKDGEVDFHAETQNSSMMGDASSTLGTSHWVTVKITLARDTSGQISGTLVDASGNPLIEYPVWIAGFPRSKTNEQGKFNLQANAPNGDTVELYIQGKRRVFQEKVIVSAISKTIEIEESK